MDRLWQNWLWDLPVGNRRLGDCRFRLPGGLQTVAHAWLDRRDLEGLSSPEVLVDGGGKPLAWLGEFGPNPESCRIAKHSFLIEYPWDLLRAVESFLSSRFESVMAGDLHRLAVIDGLVEIGKGTRILPGVVIEGHVVIGENCKIGPNAYIRGCSAIGDHCHVGNSVEIKNSILMTHTHVGHLSYVGDSILGERVNFGAGTITANFRHDQANGRAMVGGRLLDTGRFKLGALVGDDVHTGIHTSIYPGRTIEAGMVTLPGDVVDRDLTKPSHK